MRRNVFWDATVKIEISHNLHGWQGSGLLLSPNGLFVTNYHVLPRYVKDATIEFQQGAGGERNYRSGLAKILCVNERLDLTLGACHLCVDARQKLVSREPLIYLGKGPHVGERVRVYGFKYEVSEERTGTVSGHDVFNPLRYLGKPDKADRMGIHSWHSDTPIEQGFSGGPVVREATGELIGFTWGESVYPAGKRTHAFVDVGAVNELLTAYVTARTGVTEQTSLKPRKKGLLDMVKKQLSWIRRKV